MFVVLINDNDGRLKDILYTGAHRDVAEAGFIGACATVISNWDEYTADDISAVLDAGHETFGGGCVNLIDTDGFTSDVEIRDALTKQMPDRVTVAEIVLDGEIELKQGMSVDEIIELCGKNLDAACSWDIQGSILFKGSDGKWYTITTESIIGEANPQWVADTLAEQEHA